MKFIDVFFLDAETRGKPIRNWHLALSLYRHDSGYHVRTVYRLFCWSKKMNTVWGRFLCWHFRQSLSKLNLYCGVEINIQAFLGEGVSFPHPHDIVIGKNAVVGKRVTIFNGVTLGGRPNSDGQVCYPTVEDDCILYPGSKILGGITLGKGTVVGANAVVLHSCPPGSVLAGVPARQLPHKQ